MQTRDEVGVLLLFDDLLKLKRKPTWCTLVGRSHEDAQALLAGDFNFVRLHDVLERSCNVVHVAVVVEYSP